MMKKYPKNLLTEGIEKSTCLNLCANAVNVENNQSDCSIIRNDRLFNLKMNVMNKLYPVIAFLIFPLFLNAQSYDPQNTHTLPETKRTRNVTDVYFKEKNVVKKHITVYEKDVDRPYYKFFNTEVFECKQGDVITLDCDYGIWLHKYVYIDYNRDFIFDFAGITQDHPTNDEIVAYNYFDLMATVSGFDSKGNPAKDDGSGEMPSFLIPATALGDYQMRLKVDWDSLDPIGCKQLKAGTNDGTILDFTLRVAQATDIDEMDAAKDPFIVYENNGTLFIVSDKAQSVNLYSIDGRLINVYQLIEGINQLEMLPKGVYIVNNHKVII